MNPAAQVARKPDHICPTHPDQHLTLTLKGGAGWCGRCHCYVQSANHPEPQLDPAFAAKREAARQELQKEKKRAAAKRAPKKRGKQTRANNGQGVEAQAAR